MATKTKSVPLKTAGPATTSVAVRKASNIVSIQEAMKAQIAELGSRIAPATGNMIRATQDKKIVLPDGTKTDQALQLVIVDFVVAHNFYPADFNKDDIVPPDCAAIGLDPKKMFPMSNVPNKQASDCQTCPLNAWDSGKNGKGKACNNERLMAVLPPDADEDTPMWLLKASKTAIKGFDSYVAGVARTFQSMPFGVVTTVSLNPKHDFPSFEFSDPQPNPNTAVHFARQAEARELLTAERDFSGWKPAAKSAPRKAVRR